MSLYVDIRKKLGDFTLETKFEVQDGVTGILGASGCGKSMTLRCIAGIMKPDEGHIELNGKVLFDSSRKINVRPQDRHVGLLFQNYALFPNMTVQQNLMAGLMACEKNKNTASQKIREILEKFELNGLERHKPSELSGGQQQRVALARIFLSSPDILMMDEPFSALDGYLRWNLEQELLDVLKDFAGPTLFVSHSRDEVYRICDRVCVMDHGISSPVIPVKQLFEAPESRAAALLSGCKNFARAKVTKAASAEQPGNVYVPDWGETLSYRGMFSGEIQYIGVRSHYIHPVTEQEAAAHPENTFPCHMEKVIDDVFSTVLMVRPEHAESSEKSRKQHFDKIRVEITKEFWQEFCEKEHPQDTVWLHVNPADVMVLK